jgi:hypothetical protein
VLGSTPASRSPSAYGANATFVSEAETFHRLDTSTQVDRFVAGGFDLTRVDGARMVTTPPFMMSSRARMSVSREG